MSRSERWKMDVVRHYTVTLLVKIVIPYKESMLLHSQWQPNEKKVTPRQYNCGTFGMR